MKNDRVSRTGKKPKIMVVGPSPSQIGGVATFLGILLSSPTLQEKFELIHVNTSRDMRGEGIAGRLAIININYFVRQIIQFLKMSLQEKPQISHIPINMSWAFWKETAFILLARIMGMKVVAHLHEGVFDQYYLKSPLLIRWLIGWVLHQTDVVIALSNYWKNFLLKEVRSDLNVEVVPNTVSPVFAAIAGKNKAVSTEKIVLFVGTLSRKKGVLDILKAVPIINSCYRDTQFLFAGSPETEGDSEEIKRICDEGKLDGFVEFLGVVTGQEKIDLFQRATLFVLPSYVDNFPYSILEAMSSGLPVITTPVGAIPDVVKNGRNGFLIEPGDYEALADRILKLLKDSRLRKDISAANIALIQRDYLPDVAFSHFDKIYSNLISVAWKRKGGE